VSERWEESFDTWTPRADAPDDTGTDVDREELLRLARELATQRNTEQEQARRELEQLKESLRERAEAVAERERELLALQKRLEKGKAPKTKAKPELPDPETLAARERAAFERLHEVEAREAALRSQSAQLAAKAETLAALEAELLESQSDRELAAAERERLEERVEDARRAEKELATIRVELEHQRESVEARERRARALAAGSGDPGPDPYEEREQELRQLEARLEVRERELALQRQGLDAVRIELRERERTLRRSEVSDLRQTFEPPLLPPSFADGLAAFVRSRKR
jgi:DNA repair exonuclease SbcCD ATPase subunit